MAESGPAPPAKVSAELQTAIRDDALYKIRDVTKHKAVSQRVDYDTFKNMVSVAHLRPLHDTAAPPQDKSASPAWQFGLDGPGGVHQQAHASGVASDTTPCEPPANGADFSRAWRRLRDDTQRVAYLRRIAPPHMAHLFKVELSPSILTDLVGLYAAHWRQFGDTEHEASSHVQQSLASLSTAGRFSLTVSLLNARVRAAAGALLDELDAARGGTSPESQDLRALFSAS